MQCVMIPRCESVCLCQCDLALRVKGRLGEADGVRWGSVSAGYARREAVECGPAYGAVRVRRNNTRRERVCCVSWCLVARVCACVGVAGLVSERGRARLVGAGGA